MRLIRHALATLASAKRPKRGSPPLSRAAADASTASWSDALAQGRLPEALDAIAARPEDATSSIARARVLRRWGRSVEALDALDGASADRAASFDDVDALAWHARMRGRRDAAVALSERAKTLAPDRPDAWTSLGAALLAAGRPADAIACLDEATGRFPSHLDARVGLAHAHLAAGDPAAAEAVVRAAVDAHPGNAAALEHLAGILWKRDRIGEAIATYERVLHDRLPGASPDTPVNLGVALCHAGREGEGVDALLAALPVQPNANGFMQLGPSLLARGEFDEGWRQFEHRWRVPPLAALRADYGVPAWRGQPLAGETILVRAEQGLGDMVQFARYLPMLKAEGARVLFQPLRGLDRFARSLPGIDHVVEEGERLPPFAYYANLLSLPLAFGTTVDTIPSGVPYLAPDPAYVAKWRTRFPPGARPRVGLAWAGRAEHLRDRFRSIPLEALMPILRTPGITFVSLQKGAAAEQAEAIPEAVDWIGLGPELDELDDAAAVLSLLDLLVCVDTGLAHIAGAMGKPVWMLVPTPSDYRWLEDREDSPWYPSMRMFRQKASRAWAPVIDDVATALRSWSSAPAPSPPSPLRSASTRSARTRIPHLARAAETRSGFLAFDPDAPLMGPSLERLGEWLQAQLEHEGRWLRAGAIVAEAHAGCGAHTIPIARGLGAHGRLLAWEPRRVLARLLEQNLALHACANVQAMSRTLGGDGFDAGRESIDDLRLARLDGLKLNDDPGAAAILAGATDTLWRCRPWITAIAEDAAALSVARARAVEAGYRAWRMRVPVYRATNFNRRPDDDGAGTSFELLFATPEEWDVGERPAGCDAWA